MGEVWDSLEVRVSVSRERMVVEEAWRRLREEARRIVGWSSSTAAWLCGGKGGMRLAWMASSTKASSTSDSSWRTSCRPSSSL